jgi:hypothetical protein
MNDKDTALDYQAEVVKIAEWVDLLIKEYAIDKTPNALRNDKYYQKMKNVSIHSQHTVNFLAQLAEDLKV